MRSNKPSPDTTLPHMGFRVVFRGVVQFCRASSAAQAREMAAGNAVQQWGVRFNEYVKGALVVRERVLDQRDARPGLVLDLAHMKGGLAGYSFWGRALCGTVERGQPIVWTDQPADVTCPVCRRKLADAVARALLADPGVT